MLLSSCGGPSTSGRWPYSVVGVAERDQGLPLGGKTDIAAAEKLVSSIGREMARYGIQ